MQIRPATIHDLPYALRCWEADWAERPVRGRVLTQELARQTQLFARIVSGEEPGAALVVPGVALTLWAGPPPILRDAGIWVEPGQRRRGLARELLAEVLSWAKRQGYSQVVASPAADNKPSQALFEGAGWSLAHLIYLKEL